eukprot:Plantae.Rhodophyta-Purpureofilum_apyrenoidigerum.ctg4347.p1 GENE.Plantae.Rhodophyta-Purpureofilum_apyrenoidigerum.ctg4347~~Plantae.Rhodophyta-Purpureofilum_apyrenoidigerum.ctg4347.p1  ORF type:complete len:301 (+),score=37.28 Plantae.Rhodophyta-Purpureofilum_apyrenoidigerum.ctg4347:229-1131(+)
MVMMLVGSRVESIDCSFVTTDTTNKSDDMSALEILCSVATNPASKQGSATDSKVKCEDKHLVEPNTSCNNARMSSGDSEIVRSTSAVQSSQHERNRQHCLQKSATSSLSHSTDKSGLRRGSHKQDVGQTNRRTRRQDYTRFSSDEERYLLEGINQFGVGSWKKILTSYNFHRKRTPVDLKDKHRNMMKMKLRQKRKLERLCEQGGHESDVSNNCLRGEDTRQSKQPPNRTRKSSEFQTSIRSLCNTTTSNSPDLTTKLIPVHPVGNGKFRSELAGLETNLHKVEQFSTPGPRDLCMNSVH